LRKNDCFAIIICAVTTVANNKKRGKMTAIDMISIIGILVAVTTISIPPPRRAAWTSAVTGKLAGALRYLGSEHESDPNFWNKAREYVVYGSEWVIAKGEIYSYVVLRPDFNPNLPNFVGRVYGVFYISENIPSPYRSSTLFCELVRLTKHKFCRSPHLDSIKEAQSRIPYGFDRGFLESRLPYYRALASTPGIWNFRLRKQAREVVQYCTQSLALYKA
jgi:hypothetical protein